VISRGGSCRSRASFLLDGDHDAYSTIFAQRKGSVSRAADTLRAAEIREGDDYVREL